MAEPFRMKILNMDVSLNKTSDGNHMTTMAVPTDSTKGGDLETRDGLTLTLPSSPSSSLASSSPSPSSSSSLMSPDRDCHPLLMASSSGIKEKEIKDDKSEEEDVRRMMEKEMMERKVKEILQISDEGKDEETRGGHASVVGYSLDELDIDELGITMVNWTKRVDYIRNKLGNSLGRFNEELVLCASIMREGTMEMLTRLYMCLKENVLLKKEMKRKEMERKEIVRKKMERKDIEIKHLELELKEMGRKVMERELEIKEMGRKELERKEKERKKEEIKELERKEMERKELERKEKERKEIEKKELDRKEMERKELERKEMERKEMERKDLERKEMVRKEMEEKEIERMKMERKEKEKKEVERKEKERKEMERKKEFERKELERKMIERKEMERKEMERKEKERKDLERKEMVRKKMEEEMERKEIEKKRMERNKREEMAEVEGLCGGPGDAVGCALVDISPSALGGDIMDWADRIDGIRRKMGNLPGRFNDSMELCVTMIKEGTTDLVTRLYESEKEKLRFKEEIRRLNLSLHLCKGRLLKADAAANIAQSMMGLSASEGNSASPPLIREESPSLPPLPQRNKRNFIAKSGGDRVSSTVQSPPPMVNRGFKGAETSSETHVEVGLIQDGDGIPEWK